MTQAVAGLPELPPVPGLDLEAVQDVVARVLADEIYWFPVRHHSPAVAWHVEAAIRERRPRLVLIEGPSEATDLVPHVVDKRTRPPVALYSSYRDDQNVLGLAGIASPSESIPARFPAWYPLLAYSPEYVAMKTAAAIGAQVEFIDLPHWALIRPRPKDDGPGPGSQTPPDSRPDAVFLDSGFYQALARAGGYRNWDEAWDCLFEFGPHATDREAFRRDLLTFCAAARATTVPERLLADGTLERERFMWRAIQAALERHELTPGEALVVCGGFHLLLDRADPSPPPIAPPGTVRTSVVPYSYFRVSELSGYGAGNRAPRFYQSLFEAGLAGDRDELLARHVVAVLKRARKEGETVSSADAISIAQHARLLASLRRRPHPVLDDVHDAILTCCCKGSPERHGRGLRTAIDAVDIGSRIGAVTPALGRLPLLSDFYGELDALELGQVVDQEKRLTLRLDKREELGRRRSAFLHRLRVLGVPLVQLLEGGGGNLDSGTIFREVWRLLWSPDVETELTERALLGDTVEAAALARLREELAQHAGKAGAIAGRLRAALDMELPTLADELERACRAAIGVDGRFVSLAEALHHLLLLRRHLSYRQFREGALDELVEQCFDRACFALPEAANVPADEQEAVIEALRVVAEALLGEQERLDRDVLIQHVESAAGASTVPFLRGAFLGLLAELRVISAETLAGHLAAFAQEPADRMTVAGEFLDGALATSRTSLLLGAEHLVEAVDELLRVAEHDSFLVMLPRLRGAFERLHERQRLTLADRVARRHGLKTSDELIRLGTSVAAGALMAHIDEQVGRILAGWDL